MSAAIDVLNGSRQWVVLEGTAEAHLKTLPDNSFHAVGTDPPASISFMGKKWDSDKGGRKEWVQWLTGIMREALRVTRPGGWAVVWALPRRSHWTAMAVEDAGWEIRDVVHAMFGTGFPKGYIKGIKDKWKGYGTALKPVTEHWILARKPLSESSTIANLERWETGALRVDDCRVSLGGELNPSIARYRSTSQHGNAGWKHYDRGAAFDEKTAAKGRYPPHMLLVHGPGCVLNGAKKVKSGKAHRSKSGGINFGSETKVKPAMDDMTYADADGMEEVENWTCMPGCPVGMLDPHSRFWPSFRYEPKAPSREKNNGCEDLAPRDWREGTKQSTPRSGQLYEHVGRKGKDRPNNHPTVKAVELMRWLIRLVCVEGGVVLDPFNGSGTTGVACMREGMRYVGIEGGDENSPYYCEISRRRIGMESPQETLERQRPNVMDGFA